MDKLNKTTEERAQKITEYMEAAKPLLESNIVVHRDFGIWVKKHIDYEQIINGTLFVLAELKDDTSPDKILKNMHLYGYDIKNMDAIVSAVSSFSPKGEAFSRYYWEMRVEDINKNHLRK